MNAVDYVCEDGCIILEKSGWWYANNRYVVRMRMSSERVLCYKDVEDYGTRIDGEQDAGACLCPDVK